MMVVWCEGRIGMCLFAILSMILSMTVVSVNGQQVPCPPRCLCFKTTVRCMFLSMDKVPPIPAETTILDLRFNRIKEIPPDTFKNLSKLHTLLLNNNQLSKLQNGVFNGLQELRYLYLYKNKLKEIEDKVFQDLNKLEQLYLHFNKIEKLSSGIFSDMTNLERLFLHSNKLKHISPGAFNHLDNLKRLRLDSNALVCDCEMMWLAKLLQEKRQVTQAAATCQFPTTMEGRSLTEINDNDFHCTKPKITEEPRDVEISFGGTVFLTCRAEGDPQPKIVWMRDSNELNLADPRYTVRDDGTLMISPMSDSDLGVYECMAKNPAGEVKSRTAKMIYNKRSVKPHFTLTPHDYDSDEGSTITLECAAEGQPKPEVAWTRDDLQLQESPRYKISPTGTLTINNLEREDTGTYKCTASNYIGIITAVAQVRVNVLPTFVTTPENLTTKSGSLARLRCVAEGSPAPVITWFKDGNTVTPGLRFSILEGGSTLEIRDAKESDSGLYTCLAQNQVGSAESNADVRVKGFGSRPPRILLRPYPISAPVGTSIELPCKADGDPVPVISWTRDGVKIATDKTHKISPLGSLRLYNISLQDSGLYSCIATNTLGEVFADGTLSVEDVNKEGAPGDRFATLAFQEASTEVDRAVNATIQSLFSSSSGPPTPYSLMRILRFPDATSRGLARAADVFERTLVNIKKHVIAGLKVNLTQDFEYKDLLSPSVVQTLANMSGCMTHQKSVNCSDMCFHSKYRTIEGTCNNLQHPMWGASLTGFRRLLKPIYENGFSTPVGWTKGVKYFGFEKPSARLVSTEIISTDSITPDTEITHMVMQWGQFLDHDIDHAIPSTSLESWEGLDCKKTCAYSAPCFPMEVPENDPRIHNRRCMDFIRSSAICGSGLTSVFFDTMQPREQINQLTAFIDGSQVYGFTEERSRLLRELSNDYGLLRIGITSAAGKAMLPVAGSQEVDCRRDVTESNVGCFLAGDIRVNEQVGLIAMHTIWLREHNRVATALRDINPHWDGHTLFYETRKIIGAVMQHITYKHWMPHVLGAKGMQMLGEYQGYNPNLDPSISNVFATAALRFGHSLINPVLSRLDENYKTIPQGDLPLGKAFFSPWRIVEEGGTDPLMRGLFMTAAKRKLPHENLNNQLTEQLFTVAHAVALDLAAMNIQRSRDHAIPGYNDWRRHCNLTVAENFDQLAGEISNKAVREQLEKLYGHPGNIDIWVGGILEDQIDGARVGPTFRCLLIEQFRRIRDGDRFWYENPSTFKPEQLTQIKQSSFARVLCDSGDNITEITENVFLLPKAQQHTELKPCSEIPSPELRFWYDCANDCDNDVEDVRPRRDLSLDNATEERLEGLEAVVQELQKSIKTLRRRIKQLSLHHCHDSTGVQRQDNENWVKDSCTKCHCKKGQITCTTLQCAKLHCERPYHQPGACCPVCP